MTAVATGSIAHRWGRAALAVALMAPGDVASSQPTGIPAGPPFHEGRIEVTFLLQVVNCARAP